MLKIFVLATVIGIGVGQVFAQQTAPAAAPPAGGAPAPGTAPAAPQVSPEAAAAKKAFDAELPKWKEIIAKINDLQQQRANAADDNARKPIDEQIASLRHEADAVLTKLVELAIAVYRVDPNSFPEINSTLLYIAQYHLTGDARGDGGDQYEKALPLIKALLDAGAGEKWPELWTWGGVAAYATNNFDLAKDYLAKARQSGALTDLPPSATPSDPRNRIFELATQAETNLPALERDWNKEKTIREAEAKADDLPRVKLTTTKGDVVIELFENEAPEAVANFLTLVKSGFYDGVVFHRVLPGFMAQGGDPTGTGSGGPGYAIRCECYKEDYRKHFRGSLSMAHAGRDTGGSQFFLTFVPTSFLNGRHTVFGRVIEGMDVAASLKRRDPSAPTGAPDKIVKAEVLRDRGHEYKFEKLPEK